MKYKVAEHRVAADLSTSPFRREEVVRLMLQALNDFGYKYKFNHTLFGTCSSGINSSWILCCFL